MSINNKFLKSLNKIYTTIDPVARFKLIAKDFMTNDGKYINVQGIDKTGIAGFKFDVPQTEQVVMESQITTHYLENNEPVQDHIALNPVQITLTGLVGDYFYPVQKYEAIISQIIPTLNLVKEFLPQIPPAVQQAKSLFKFGQKVSGDIAGSYKTMLTASVGEEEGINKFNTLVDMFALCQQLYKLKSKQARAFYFLQLLWRNKIIFSVETSWRRFDNMVITKVVPLRDNNADITDFSVTFQQMNFVATQSEVQSAVGRLKGQMSTATIQTGKGVNVGEPNYILENS